MGFVEPIAQLWIALAVNRLVERSSLVCSLIGRSSESDVASALDGGAFSSPKIRQS
jgi:hypothetical protein